MAIVVTDSRTIVNEADATTGWNTGAAVTSFFTESTGCIAIALNIATGQLYHTGTARNVSNTLIYVYSFNNALQNVWTHAAPPNALHLGDGTDRISFKMAGSDRRVFSHSDGPTEWQCLVLDGSQASAMNSAGNTVVRAGSFAGLDLTAITQFGVDHTTLSKALAGGYNSACDIIRVGNDGLTITTTNTDYTNFLELTDLDRSTANQRAYGIIRDYTTGLYGLQGPLNFGSATSGNCYFQDSNVTLAFENRNISNDKYYLRVQSTSGGTTNFILANSTITTAGPHVTLNFSGTNINTLTLTDCTFRSLGNSISFGNDASAAGHTVTGNVFDGCGQIDPGDVIFENNVISNTTASTTGGLLLDADGTSAWADLQFVSGGTGHAIYITATGTYTFSNFTYSGYGATGTTNAVIYNNSGGAVTINVSGGDTPTYRNGTSASTTVVSSVPIDVTVIDTNTDPIQNAQVGIYLSSDNTELVNTDTDVNGEVSDSFSGTTPANIYLRIRKSSTGDTKYIPASTTGSITSTGFSITITLREDPNA